MQCCKPLGVNVILEAPVNNAQEKCCSIFSRYSWDNILQVQTLCNVTWEAPDNIACEKLQETLSEKHYSVYIYIYIVNPSHTDESWEGQNTCLWIYKYVYICNSIDTRIVWKKLCISEHIFQNIYKCIAFFALFPTPFVSVWVKRNIFRLDDGHFFRKERRLHLQTSKVFNKMFTVICILF